MDKTKTNIWHTVLPIALLGTFLRLFRLGHQQLWYDEARAILGEGKNPFAMWAHPLSFPNPPVYFTLLHYWMSWFPDKLFAARLFSALAGILLVLLVFFAGARLFSPRVGLLASLLAAISPYILYYSQEARVYTFLALLCLLSVYLFFLALTEEKKRYWAAYALAITLAFYVHTYALFPFLANGVFFLSFPDRFGRLKKRFAGTTAAILLLFLPRFLIFAQQLGQQMNPWIGRIPEGLEQTFRHYALLSWHMPLTPLVKTALYLLTPLFAFFFVKALVWKEEDVSGKDAKNLTVINLVFCALLPFLISKTIVAIYVPGRYDITGYPFFILMVSLGLDRLRRPWVRNASVSLIILLTVLTLPAYYFLYQKGNSKDIAALIKREAGPQDILVFTNQSYLAISYYLPPRGKCLSYPEETPGGYIPKEGLEGKSAYVDAQADLLLSKIAREKTADSKVWVFYNEDPLTLNNALIDRLQQAYRLEKQQDLPRKWHTYFQVNKCYLFE